MERDDLKIPEFARRANVAEITVRRRVLAGEIKALKDALGRWRIPPAELDRFLRRSERGAA